MRFQSLVERHNKLQLSYEHLNVEWRETGERRSLPTPFCSLVFALSLVLAAWPLQIVKMPGLTFIGERTSGQDVRTQNGTVRRKLI